MTVYDVTRFLDDHPGGDEILLNATGRDATEEFVDFGHSDNAREMLKEYIIGSVDGSTLPVKQKPPSQPTARSSQSMVKLVQFILPLMILGIAFALKMLNKEE